jgi:predicted nucleic acid-binding protein
MLSRDLIIDASGVINLLGGGIAEACLQFIEPASQVTPVVERECNKKEATALAFRNLLDAGLLGRHLDEISAEELAAFIEDNDLGAGESEAILACEQVGKDLWCDDRRARNVARERLGDQRVTGTLGVLLELVRLQDLAPEVAHVSYEAMIAAGGFLPARTLDEFTLAQA